MHDSNSVPGITAASEFVQGVWVTLGSWDDLHHFSKLLRFLLDIL